MSGSCECTEITNSRRGSSPPEKPCAFLVAFLAQLHSPGRYFLTLDIPHCHTSPCPASPSGPKMSSSDTPIRGSVQRLPRIGGVDRNHPGLAPSAPLFCPRYSLLHGLALPSFLSQACTGSRFTGRMLQVLEVRQCYQIHSRGRVSRPA